MKLYSTPAFHEGVTKFIKDYMSRQGIGSISGLSSKVFIGLVTAASDRYRMAEELSWVKVQFQNEKSLTKKR